MRSFLSTRFARYVLSPLLAIWVAGGGCLFGCEGKILAAVQETAGILASHGAKAHETATHEVSRPESEGARHEIVQEGGASCATGQAHHCCAKTPVKKSGARPAAPSKNVRISRTAESVAAVTARTHEKSRSVPTQAPKITTGGAIIFGNSPSGMMEGCPLAVNATAIVSSFRNDQSSVAITSAPSTLRWLSSPEETSPPVPPPRIPSLNRTYLNCCVFLI
ncbi:MAG TPA: hypothetical protein VMM84_16465 [Pyrinomonadaceae bacterium]|nr:hypothetical protein [Pyrinomonadaceae bacterium]